MLLYHFLIAFQGILIDRTLKFVTILQKIEVIIKYCHK